MRTDELLDELHRLRSLAHALFEEIERLEKKVEQQRGVHSGTHGAARKVPSLQMPAVKVGSRPPKR